SRPAEPVFPTSEGGALARSSHLRRQIIQGRLVEWGASRRSGDPTTEIPARTPRAKGEACPDPDGVADANGTVSNRWWRGRLPPGYHRRDRRETCRPTARSWARRRCPATAVSRTTTKYGSHVYLSRGEEVKTRPVFLQFARYSTTLRPS